jgi:hypothetical protein
VCVCVCVFKELLRDSGTAEGGAAGEKLLHNSPRLRLRR